MGRDEHDRFGKKPECGRQLHAQQPALEFVAGDGVGHDDRIAPRTVIDGQHPAAERVAHLKAAPAEKRAVAAEFGKERHRNDLLGASGLDVHRAYSFMTLASASTSRCSAGSPAISHISEKSMIRWLMIASMVAPLWMR
ncbi:hypothetical protein SDC9_121849 [bioreactor metagenome]|uniref:Uncharacterized protein n=1 Tax=bioreactor metagenome TaxID=1076179 RepID=A0A645CD68_9ZZZZ